MISLSGKPKKDTKIILEFSMMKMDRTLPAFLTKCFTIASYYFSCNSLQVFLMKEQFIFCKDSMQILGVVFHSLKKARSLLKSELTPRLSTSTHTTWLFHGVSASQNQLGLVLRGKESCCTKGKWLLPSRLLSGGLYRVVSEVRVKCSPGVLALRLPA